MRTSRVVRIVGSIAAVITGAAGLSACSDSRVKHDVIPVEP